MKKLLVILFATVLALGLTGQASATPITILNNSFETGDLSGWSSDGIAKVVTAFTSSTGGNHEKADNVSITYSATDGDYFAKLRADALVSQVVTWHAGDVLAFDWAFSAKDFMPWNDYAYFKVGGDRTFLAGVSTVGDFGETNWATYTHTFLSGGTGSIEFGVVNDTDDAYDSKLLIDNVHSPVPTPEPATMLLLGTGLLGLAGAARLRNKKKA